MSALSDIASEASAGAKHHEAAKVVGLDELISFTQTERNHERREAEWSKGCPFKMDEKRKIANVPVQKLRVRL